MTNEERDLIEKFVARVGGAATGVFGRSVPSTQPNLPPIDPDADRFIAEQFQTHPEARYRITQMAVVQEAALAEAANRMQRMQAELEQLQQQLQQQQAGGQQQKSGGGFFSGLFGGQQQPQAPRPAPGVWNQGAPPPQQQYAQPQYAPPPQYAPVPPPPNVQPGMFQRGGSGFLGSALTTAAGVAGGVVAGNVLMDMFSGHGGGGMFGGGGFGGGFAGGMPAPVEETTIINNYGDAGGGGAGWDNATQTDPGAGWDNAGGYDNGGGGFDDNSGGGFDDQSV
jgi:hypothetical protein